MRGREGEREREREGERGRERGREREGERERVGGERGRERGTHRVREKEGERGTHMYIQEGEGNERSRGSSTYVDCVNKPRIIVFTLRKI